MSVCVYIIIAMSVTIVIRSHNVINDEHNPVLEYVTRSPTPIEKTSIPFLLSVNRFVVGYAAYFLSGRY